MRLAHFSDLHLLSGAGVRWLELANKRWIGAMNLLTNRARHYHTAAFEDMVVDLNAQRIDHILCTGDVTNLALQQEFEFARTLFDRLALGPSDVTVLPGNHDAYVAEGVPLFAALFAPYSTTDPGWEWTDADRDPEDDHDDLHWPIVRIRGSLALVGTSTSRATPWFTAYGRVGAGQLARLAKVLADPRLAGKARVVAIHHPPAGKRAFSRIRGLRDHEAFATVIKGVGADLVVHGHEHRDMTEQLAGPAGDVVVRGVPSGTYEHGQPERTARYRIFEIEDGHIVGETERVWDREQHTYGLVTPAQGGQIRAM
jgi:3',5'-cyclic AMP phosphodiesterase CpdA